MSENRTLTFGDALNGLLNGMYKSIQRSGWNGKGLEVKLQRPDSGSKMTLPYLYIEYPNATKERGNPIYPEGSRCPWVASQSDLFAEDWIVYMEGETY